MRAELRAFLARINGLARRPRAGRVAAAGLAISAIVCASACTAAQRTGQSSSYVIINSLLGASGAEPDRFGSTVGSDVITLVAVTGEETRRATLYEDPGQVSAVMAMKDPGSATNPTTPSTNNWITINRYHVQYLRADGRNTPGVDVPYPFDGAVTFTVNESGTTAGFTLVRSQAKREAPLSALAGLGGAISISTIAEVTFYGSDQTGRAVTAVGRIGVNFSDYGDPQ